MLHPIFSTAELLQQLLQRTGTLTTVLQAAYYFFSIFSAGFFNRVFVAALWSDRGQRSKQLIACWQPVAWRNPWPTKKASCEAPSVF